MPIKLNKTLVLLSMSLFVPLKLTSQVAPFLGGNGDGFGIASTSFNMSNIEYEGNPLTVTINQSISQADPSDQEPVSFSVVFSDIVSDFCSADILSIGTSVPQNFVVTGSGTSYTVLCSNMGSNGDIILQIPTGSTHNSFGRPNSVSTSTDNSVNFFGAKLTLAIELASNQSLYSNNSNVHFTVKFSEDVVDFAPSDIDISGTAFPLSTYVTGSGSVYDVMVSGMAQDGSVIISIPENRVFNNYGEGNEASPNSGNLIYVDYTPPGVAITQEIGQTDPSASLPVKFHIEFTEDVEDFFSQNISYGASAAVYLEIEGSGKSYTVSAFGLQSNETLSIVMVANAAHDKSGNYNTPSVNTDNSITYTGTTSIGNLSDKNNYIIYSANGNINIKFIEIPDKNSTLNVFDLNGKLIYSKQSLNQINSFPINQSSIYVIKITNRDKISGNVVAPLK